jgi:hypothetical protein
LARSAARPRRGGFPAGDGPFRPPTPRGRPGNSSRLESADAPGHTNAIVGALLAHAGGYWHVFDENERAVVAVADGKVVRTTVLRPDQRRGTSPPATPAASPAATP